MVSHIFNVDLPKCGKEFSYSSELIRHQKVKKPCNTIKNININYDNRIKNIDNYIKNNSDYSIENFKCFFCKNKLLNKANTQRHIKFNCNVLKELINNKNKLFEEKNKLLDENIKVNKTDKIDKENKELKNVINKLLKKHFSINQTINNNTQNNIMMINSFGKENLNHITIEDYKKYFNKFFPGFIEFIEKIHFDENAPENHNIFISNLKSKYLSVFDDGKWITKEKNDIIDDLIIKKYNLLSDKCEQLEESKQINDKTIKNFEEFCENYDNEESQKTTKKNIMLMIYNNKNKIKNKPK